MLRSKWLLASSATGVAALMFAAAPTAFAANGDNLRTIIADRTGTLCASYDQQGHHSSVGVGVAFDGTSLLISCYSDNTVTAINPADGSQVAVHTISGANSLGALAWDNGRHLLWACSNFNTVGTIDLTTNAFTPVFSSAGCFDGLAYDGSDDSIWSSEDVASSIQHYTSAGVLLTSQPLPAGWPGCGNSGIAVGGTNLYLANDGCSQIVTADKGLTAATLFATFPARIEDMECDNVTFGASSLGAIWSIDAYDNILNAWEIPFGSCSFGGGGNGATGWMTGGGSVFTNNTSRVTHGFQLNCDASIGGNLQINWGKNNRFHLTELTSARCSDDPAIEPAPPGASFDTYVGEGTGRYNGVPGATVRFTFSDAGEPGTADFAQIEIKDVGGHVVLEVSGPLAKGNHQAHQD